MKKKEKNTPPLSTAEIEIITGKKTNFETCKQIILNDYQLACESRQVSLMSRKEVLTGKAKFGICGDGKEIPQIVLAKNFQNGDFRAGYYRDQTLMLAINAVTLEQLFAQLYAHPSLEADPHSQGRQMNAHFATRSINENGEWNNLMLQKNSLADVSCTAAQMAPAVGLALASKKYRQLADLKQYTTFSDNGNEVVFANIGDASTSEGLFFEAINAACVMQIPLITSVWDDGYGISVPIQYQTTKASISEALRGFEQNKQSSENEGNMLIFTAKAHDYYELCKTYKECVEIVRKTHKPALMHIQEVTQPQGHSTSGSHERYKTPERLKWEKENDCITKMRQWIENKHIATAEELDIIEKIAADNAKYARESAYKNFNNFTTKPLNELIQLYNQLLPLLPATEQSTIESLKKELTDTKNPTLLTTAQSVRNAILILQNTENKQVLTPLQKFRNQFQAQNTALYTSHLHSESKYALANIQPVPATYPSNPAQLPGYQILNTFFDSLFQKHPNVFAFGEDVGKIGDVNQGFMNLQQKYGEKRIFDTGIRELTIMGQGIGMAMRGLRPIAEIQYLDYLIYGLQPLSDELATLQYRSAGGQKAPLIVRTRGHRLEGIWHAGSPMAMILNTCKGIALLTPRNMTQAAGFYNTLIQSDEPAIVVECLNAYRKYEPLPQNLAQFCVPVGTPEILAQGTHITVVTYGSCCPIVQEAAQKLHKHLNISCEIIDIQSLMPFDINHIILQSLKKTNRLLIVDEDVPGGASAYILQQILEVQKGYQYLDSPPSTLTAKPNRCAFGSDGDYYCKPNTEDVFETIANIIHEAQPQKFTFFV